HRPARSSRHPADPTGDCTTGRQSSLPHRTVPRAHGRRRPPLVSQLLHHRSLEHCTSSPANARRCHRSRLANDPRQRNLILVTSTSCTHSSDSTVYPSPTHHPHH